MPSLAGASLAASPLTTSLLVGTLLVGRDRQGKPIDVAICDVEPDAKDPVLVRYRLEYWDEQKQIWAEPCVATRNVPHPRALVLGGTWNAQAAHHDTRGQVTFACEAGVVAKCINLLEYKPWQEKNGQSLAAVHQACTRMMRADYCGNGQSHTREGTIIDADDNLGMQVPMTPGTAVVAGIRAEQLVFEGAFDASGAVCLARTRYGEPIEAIMAECPGRFERMSKEVRKGEMCVAWRKGTTADATTVPTRSLPRQEVTANAAER